MTTAAGFCYAGIKEKLHVWQVSSIRFLIGSCYTSVCLDIDWEIVCRGGKLLPAYQCLETESKW